VEKDELTTYFQATRDFFNERLKLDLFWVFLNPGDGNILRLSGSYELREALSVQAGVVFYDAADAATDLYPYKDRDRIFVRLKYSF